ncbi:hypothetical protein AAHA92_21479 [Salvia divinorum]|uniref:Secreted protein n=1 Tax=Salvia divinorum TaxID=28513 RepID=A0ABD1GKK9_SALDI
MVLFFCVEVSACYCFIGFVHLHLWFRPSLPCCGIFNLNDCGSQLATLLDATFHCLSAAKMQLHLWFQTSLSCCGIFNLNDCGSRLATFHCLSAAKMCFSSIIIVFD